MRVQMPFPFSVARRTVFLSFPVLVTMFGLLEADAYSVGGGSVQLQFAFG